MCRAGHVWVPSGRGSAGCSPVYLPPCCTHLGLNRRAAPAERQHLLQQAGFALQLTAQLLLREAPVQVAAGAQLCVQLQVKNWAEACLGALAVAAVKGGLQGRDGRKGRCARAAQSNQRHGCWSRSLHMGQERNHAGQGLQLPRACLPASCLVHPTMQARQQNSRVGSAGSHL